MTVSLDWTESVSNVSQVETYELYRSENVRPDDPDFLTSFSKLETFEVERDDFGEVTNDPTSYVDSTVDLSSNFYHYYVLAVPVRVGEANNPSESPTRSNIVAASAKPSPFTLTVTWDAPNNESDLSWTDSIGFNSTVETYVIYRSVDDGEYEQIATVAATAANAYTDDDVARLEHKYKYKVTAQDDLGVTIDSNEVELLQSTQAIVAFSQDDTFLRSTDGETWTEVSLPFARQWVDAAFSPALGRLVVIARNNDDVQVLYTDDFGDNWTNAGRISSIGSWAVVIWDPESERFIAGNYNSINNDFPIAYSSDGVNWNVVDISGVDDGTGFRVSMLASNENGIVVGNGSSGGSDTNIRSLDGGATWQGWFDGGSGSSSGRATAYDLTRDRFLFIFGFRRSSVSVDGQNFTQVANTVFNCNNDQQDPYLGLAYSPTLDMYCFAMAANTSDDHGVFTVDAGALGIFSDPNTWTRQLTFNLQNGPPTRVLWSENFQKFFVTGGSGTGRIVSSGNGTIWTTAVTPNEVFLALAEGIYAPPPQAA